MLQRRFLCSKVPKQPHRHQWTIKQVIKSNFNESLEQIKNYIHDCDFVALSLKETGSYSAPWHRVLPIDTAETAYFKAKYAAERFQVLQFAVCPFSIRASKVIAYPYNFHLFPRDELKTGMPSYSFSCQSSYLSSMAQEGFDFNVCIYNGMSYLSRAQESAAKDQIGNPMSSNYVVQSSSNLTVADSLFVERIKSRVGHWRNTCKGSTTRTHDALLSSLRKLVLGSEVYGSRPCLCIEVCSEHQVHLVLEMLRDFSDDLVPLLIPGKGGGTQAVRVVLTSSKKDKNLFERELQHMEEEQNRRARGFREVIDSISASQKPVVAHNSLNVFTFIHSKFLTPLPSSMDEFRCSLRLVFPHVLDVNHLINEVDPLKRVTNLPLAIAYIKRRFCVPTDLEIPQQAEASEGKIHGLNVLRISQLFSRLCSVLKVTPEALEDENGHLCSALKRYANIFNPCSTSSQNAIDGDATVWMDNTRKARSEHIVFLWGFRHGVSARMLKNKLHCSHEVFLSSEEFDVRLIDKSCAIVVFWNPGLSDRFLEVMDSGGISCEPVREMISEGLRAASYEIYRRVCRLGLWKPYLADSLDEALADTDSLSEANLKREPSEIYWDSESMINLDDL